MNEWMNDKPKHTGRYFTRHPDGSNVNEVIVKKYGRGLSVFCPRYNEQVPMSEIGSYELEWMKAPEATVE